MTHRAAVIVNRIAALIDARLQPTGVHVYTDRREALDAEQDELPAVSVDYADDTVNQQGEDWIDSTLNVLVTALVKAPSSVEIRSKLLELREAVHIAIAADRTLGLDFVIDIIVEGATTSAPEIAESGEAFAGALVSAWPIKYRMHFEDPGATGSVPNL